MRPSSTPTAVLWLVTACALATLGLVDLWLGEFSGADGPARLSWAVAACAVALRPGRPHVPAVLQALGAAVAWWATRHDPTVGLPFTLSATAALLTTLGLLVWRENPRWAAFTAPPLAAAVLLQPLRGDLDGPRPLVGVLVLALGVAVATSAGLAVRHTAAARTRQAERARAAQRAEFARDLHDFVAHHVTGMVVRAQGAAAVAPTHPELVLPALREIERAGVEAVDAMRRAVGLLRRPEDDPAPGIPEIPDLVERFRRTAPFPTTLTVHGPFTDTHPTTSAAAYRVVMEALTNARKHAHDATAVTVSVHRTDTHVEVRVTDDGHPRTAPSTGFGLLGLRERVTAAGGTMTAGPTPDGGWAVEATLPAGKGP
ncbi:sensor histidine kinase [Saccharothrix syringae]|uniref:histidine kinase n=1 Tax=Saccharothrix syringae TaxID=103733 RepID=A0A5Q0GU25_SACSY|nr:histidine kinase [Saccharothrix syringae]QFZ16984.1 two-component sensor histidine kinase [Saccharothrix syringae]